MLKKVLRTIHEHSIFSVGDTVIVAVSGGVDSVVLLDILASMKELRLRLVVAHLNHRLRGDESDGDEAFVRKLAEKYGVTFVTQAVDVRQLSRDKNLSLEDAGRVARYAFFDDIYTSCKANAVALAHHADDQAETVLLRLLRGAGGSGLCAMAPKSRYYVRPLLYISRAEVEAYQRRNGLVFRFDSSNVDSNFLRNRVRHELIPTLLSYNPAITERLAVTAEVLTEDETLLEKLTDVVFSRYCSSMESGLSLAIAGLTSEPRGLRFRLYRRAILSVKGDLARIAFCHLKGIDLLISSPRPNGKIALPDGFQVSRCYGNLLFAAHGEPLPEHPFEELLEGPGSYALPGGVLILELLPAPKKRLDVAGNVAYFDAKSLTFPLLVRTFRPGDRIVPLGMKGRKKVKDLFIDEKVPLPARRKIPLLFSGAQLLWVCGVRSAAEACLTPSTTSVIRAEIRGFLP